jgi:hypothetical protein
VNESLVLNATRRFSSVVATRSSRRSFIGRAGRFAFVLAAGGAMATRFADPALALMCDCAGPGCNTGCSGDRSKTCDVGGHSVSCKGLTGTGGECPNCTVPCGVWTCGCSSCASGTRIWTDCCANCDQCSSGSSCRCVRDTDMVTRKTCCFRHCYQGGQSDCHFIVCRFEQCA